MSSTRSYKLYEIREKVIQILKQLAKELNAVIYLFGSYARGDHLLDSDIDIIVVSEEFRNMKPSERAWIVRSRLPRDLSFDIIALTPEEFEKKKNNIFFKEISRHWIEIKP